MAGQRLSCQPDEVDVKVLIAEIGSGLEGQLLARGTVRYRARGADEAECLAEIHSWIRRHIWYRENRPGQRVSRP
jgi:hypothetical protein